MRSVQISGATGAPAHPEILREARLRSRGLPPATARAVAVLAFGEVREPASWSLVAAPVMGARHG